MKKQIKKIGIVLICLIIGILIGQIIKSSIPWYGDTKIIPGENLSEFSQPMPNWVLTDPEKLISFSKKEDVEQKRNDLIQFIWKTKELPKTLPDKIEKDFSDERYKDMKNLQSIDKLRIDMDLKLKSIAYHFKPARKKKNKLIIYVQGHNGDFIYGYDTIEFFVKKGYDVVAFSMPLLGLNSEPIGETERFGNIFSTELYGVISMADHNVFFLLDNPSFSPLKFFFHPLTTTLNYMQQEYDFEVVAMVGISGGGWMTTVYPALDPRIQKSYPVAGSQPFYLLSDDYDLKVGVDYEGLNAGLYRIANYLELYVMGAHGKNRNQIQVLNKYDSCCFNGIGYTTYENVVSDKVKELGEGDFRVFSDETHAKHEISPTAMKLIAKDIEKN